MSERRGIVVGVDGSDGSQAALEWARREAGHIRPIRPVFTWKYPYTVWLPAGIGGVPAPSEELMQADAEAAASLAMGSLDDADVEDPIVTRGDAGAVLVEHAETAELLVVGSRGHGTLTRALVGSVSRYCADHTPVPLVIVPEDDDDEAAADPNPGGPRTIVVGVDGSANSDAALSWAVRFARPGDGDRPGDKVHAINAWNFIAGMAYSQPPIDVRKVAAASEEMLAEVTERVCAEAGVDPSMVVQEVADGDPRHVLHARQSDADLIVVGSRGHSGLAHLVLGSTASAMIHRPECPIAVVPHSDDA